MVLTPIARLVNSKGIDLIKQWESLRLTAYQDQVGIWTVGWGHTQNVTPGLTIDDAEATRLLYYDLLTFEQCVTVATSGFDTNENQFSAMVCLAFNIGCKAFLGSSVLLRHKSGSFYHAANAFLMWDKIHLDGKLVDSKGLLNRRNAERSLYLTPASALDKPVLPPEEGSAS